MIVSTVDKEVPAPTCATLVNRGETEPEPSPLEMGGLKGLLDDTSEEERWYAWGESVLDLGENPGAPTDR